MYCDSFVLNIGIAWYCIGIVMMCTFELDLLIRRAGQIVLCYLKRGGNTLMVAIASDTIDDTIHEGRSFLTL